MGTSKNTPVILNLFQNLLIFKGLQPPLPPPKDGKYSRPKGVIARNDELNY